MGGPPDYIGPRQEQTSRRPRSDFAASEIDQLIESVTGVGLRLNVSGGVNVIAFHVVGHLALGHVRPGDKWGHWDTATTVSSATPHRVWDQAANAFLARSFAAPPTRRVESLDQCTPAEKAQLGLWPMIGEMLGGESRRLHPSAERYQLAAYQRQAAQRLVSMLQDFGGAMLCDGVGLGKTYVATTMMVHYVNARRDTGYAFYM